MLRVIKRKQVVPRQIRFELTSKQMEEDHRKTTRFTDNRPKHQTKPDRSDEASCPDVYCEVTLISCSNQQGGGRRTRKRDLALRRLHGKIKKPPPRAAVCFLPRFNYSCDCLACWEQLARFHAALVIHINRQRNFVRFIQSNQSINKFAIDLRPRIPHNDT